MRLFKKMRTDFAIYWQRAGVGDDASEPTFLPPVVIKCRWDNQQQDHEVNEAIENIRTTATIFPDRVLVPGSFLMHGNDAVLNALSDKEKMSPKSLAGAVMLKTQKITAKWRVKNIQWKPNDQSDDIFIEVIV